MSHETPENKTSQLKISRRKFSAYAFLTASSAFLGLSLPTEASPAGDLHFTIPGTHTLRVPQGVSSLKYTLIGGSGGGGGGGGKGFNSPRGSSIGLGGHGAAGETVRGTMKVKPGSVIRVTIGEGGLGGEAGGDAICGAKGGIRGRSVSRANRAQSGAATGSIAGGGGGAGGQSGNPSQLTSDITSITALGGAGGGGGEGQLLVGQASGNGFDGAHSENAGLGGGRASFVGGNYGGNGEPGHSSKADGGRGGRARTAGETGAHGSVVLQFL